MLGLSPRRPDRVTEVPAEQLGRYRPRDPLKPICFNTAVMGGIQFFLSRDRLMHLSKSVLLHDSW